MLEDVCESDDVITENHPNARYVFGLLLAAFGVASWAVLISATVSLSLQIIC